MDSPCIPWTGSLNDQGYGRAGSLLAHRVAWAEVHGPIPRGATIDHICHDPNLCRLGRECPHRRCVNVAHMELVTHAQNASRGWRRASMITNCPEGHLYEGDNLLVSNGRRHCRECKRSHQRAIRRARARDKCLMAGHEPDLAIGKDGRELCKACRSTIASQALKGRRRDASGRVT